MIELMISAAVLGMVMAGLLGLLDGQPRRLLARNERHRRAAERARGPRAHGQGDPRGGVSPAAAGHVAGDMSARRGQSLPVGGELGFAVLELLPHRRPRRPPRMTLQYDWNGDGAITTAGKVNDPINCPTGATCRGEQVTYSLSGTTLMRQEVGVDLSAQPVATGITSLTFTYLKDDNYDRDQSRGHPECPDPDHRDDGLHDRIRFACGPAERGVGRMAG